MVEIFKDMTGGENQKQIGWY